MDKLRKTIEDNPDVKPEDKEAVYVHLWGYMNGVPDNLRESLGTEEEIVKRFIEQCRDKKTIQSCLDRLNWYSKFT